MKPKILVIGLDAATMDLIGPWAAGGHLPAIHWLMSAGARGRLLSTANMHSASAWTSILTGLNPGRHGLFVFSDRDFATGRQMFFKGGDRAGQLVISHLARQGLGAGLLNVPMTYPAEGARSGFMVSGLDAPSLNEKAFYPAELRADLFAKFPDYNFTPLGLGDLMSAGRIETAVQAWLRLIETQTAAAEYLIQTRPVDFFMTVYTASDWGGHNLWKFLGEDIQSENLLLGIYRALDEAIAKLLKHVDEQAHVYVISDHGMGCHSGASYHLAEWLEAKGYMSRKSQPHPRASIINAGRKAARTLLPVGLRERVKAGIGDERVKRLQAAEKDSFYGSIDWGRTTAYSEPGRHVININLEGRNQTGIVKQGDYDRVRDQIRDDLSRWEDAGGTRVVERVARREEVYSGPFVERASDLYVYWNTSANLGAPPREVQARGFWWSGDHRPEGVLICKGPGIRSRALSNNPTVYDLVPTICYLAGLPVPAGLDGGVIKEMCDENLLAERPIKVESAAGGGVAARDDLTKSEEQMIEEKLRGLGYL
jgi:predicted AlkP superfamily phosphohydrolase/phosphomutase